MQEAASAIWVHVCLCVCVQVYLNRHANPRKKLLVPCPLDPPNPRCYVCASKPEVALRLNVNTLTVKLLEDKVRFLIIIAINQIN